MQINKKNLSQEDKDYELSLLYANIPFYPIGNWKPSGWTTFPEFVSKCGLTLDKAKDLLQSHGYFVEGKEWCEEFRKHGFVFALPEYQGVSAEFGLIKYFNDTIVSPHGQRWFENFFELAELIFNPQIW